jgi:hypothetical protein
LISLDFQVPEIHAPAMKILLMMVVAQFLTMVVFAWFNRGAWIRILALRQQVGAYKRQLQKPMLGWNKRKTLLKLGGSSGHRGHFGFSRTTRVDQELLLRYEYLVAENRILKAQIKGQLRPSDAERTC